MYIYKLNYIYRYTCYLVIKKRLKNLKIICTKIQKSSRLEEEKLGKLYSISIQSGLRSSKASTAAPV